MASQNQLVGIIEIDADSTLDATSDEQFGDALRQIRCANLDDASGRDSVPGGSDCLWDQQPDLTCDDLVWLTANLDQLHSDLEHTLARFIDRLLAASGR